MQPPEAGTAEANARGSEVFGEDDWKEMIGRRFKRLGRERGLWVVWRLTEGGRWCSMRNGRPRKRLQISGNCSDAQEATSEGRLSTPSAKGFWRAGFPHRENKKHSAVLVDDCESALCMGE
jgi:hypothetical protein